MSKEFYVVRKMGYWEMYFGNSGKRSPFWTNGFLELPEKIYSKFLPFIGRSGNIVDFGCGNGMLLRFLKERSRFRLVPFGIDFQEEAIWEAQEVILSEYRENFRVGNIAELDFQRNLFDFALLDPYHLSDADREAVVGGILERLRPRGRLIVYSYHDAMVQLKHRRLRDFCGMERYSLSRDLVLRGEVSLACIDRPD